MRFQITGVDENGKRKTTLVDAVTEVEALAKARSLGIYAENVAVIGPSENKASPPSLPKSFAPNESQQHSAGFAGPFAYKMVQVPQTLGAESLDPNQQLAAKYLERVINKFAAEGWEFYRVDSIGIVVPPGCLGAFFGAQVKHQAFHVITFRQPRDHR
jgi:hypothetical protein